jgi:hypothetical protein
MSNLPNEADTAVSATYTDEYRPLPVCDELGLAALIH